jgi:hypothetical protein
MSDSITDMAIKAVLPDSLDVAYDVMNGNTAGAMKTIGSMFTGGNDEGQEAPVVARQSPSSFTGGGKKDVGNQILDSVWSNSGAPSAGGEEVPAAPKEEDREYVSAFLAGAAGGAISTYLNGGGDIGDYARNMATGGAAALATEAVFGNTNGIVLAGVGAATPWLLEKVGVFSPTSGDDATSFAKDAQVSMGQEETSLLSRLFSPSNNNDGPSEETPAFRAPPPLPSMSM